MLLAASSPPSNSEAPVHLTDTISMLALKRQHLNEGSALWSKTQPGLQRKGKQNKL